MVLPCRLGKISFYNREDFPSMPEEKLPICIHFQNNLNILNVDYAAFFITDLVIVSPGYGELSQELYM